MSRLDTRQKIISAGEAVELTRRRKAEGVKIVAVSGIFDVLLEAHARALAEVRNQTGAGMLLVVLLPAEGGLLSDRARAELVASLGMVDYVIIAGEDHSEEIVGRLGADVAISRRAEDEQVQRQLMEHVQRKHNG